MSRFFDLDSPLMKTLSNIADVCWINILTLICSIPIVTAGASFTAMHYMLLKIVREEEGYITKGYFKSFKENFKQATIIWLILLFFIGFFLVDCYIFLFSDAEISKVLLVILCAMGLVLYMVVLYVFPLQSHFTNSVLGTIKNAFLVGIMAFPKTLAMMVLYVLPYVIVYQYNKTFPVLLLFGISAPAYFSAWLYSGTFKKLEPNVPQDDADEAETDDINEMADASEIDKKEE